MRQEPRQSPDDVNAIIYEKLQQMRKEYDKKLEEMREEYKETMNAALVLLRMKRYTEVDEVLQTESKRRRLDFENLE